MTPAEEFAGYVRALFSRASFHDVEVLHVTYGSTSFGNAVALVRADGLVFRLVRERGEEFVHVAGPAFHLSSDIEEGLGWIPTPVSVPTTPEPVHSVLKRFHTHRADLVQALQPEHLPSTISQLERAREERGLRMVAKLEGRQLRPDRQ